MLNLKKDPVWITKVCLVLVIGAFVFSFMPRVLAQARDSVSDPASIQNPDGIIPGSESIPRVSFGSFIQNVAETTGLFAFITDKVEKETTEIDETTGKTKPPLFWAGRNCSWWRWVFSSYTWAR